MKPFKSFIATSFLVASITGGVLQLQSQPVKMQSIIVQGSDLAEVKAAVASVGGEITHELGIINAVSVQLSSASVNILKDNKAIRRIYDNTAVELAGKPPKDDGTQIPMCESSSD